MKYTIKNLTSNEYVEKHSDADNLLYTKDGFEALLFNSKSEAQTFMNEMSDVYDIKYYNIYELFIYEYFKPMGSEVIRPILYDGNEYFDIYKFDCVNIALTKNSYTFYTHLPISSAEYRVQHKSEAKVEVTVNDIYTMFVITDDYGHQTTLAIPNYMEYYIDRAMRSAKEQNLL